MAGVEKFKRAALRYDQLAREATTEVMRRHLRRVADHNQMIADQVTAVLETALPQDEAD